MRKWFYVIASVWFVAVSAYAAQPILKNSHRARTAIIEIDPGHGGKDPGTIGYKGIKEKNVVLAIAKDLREYIDRTPHMHALLTRTTDRYIPLLTRLMMGRRAGANLFVAIHANSYKNKHVHGALVFALSNKGATSEIARWTMRRENHSELVGGVNLKTKNRGLRDVLISLSMHATMIASQNLAYDVMMGLSHVTHLREDHIEKARFLVLKALDVPSILVETGFLSNPKEAMALNSKAYQHKVAKAIYSGIKRYLLLHPVSQS